MREPAYIAIGKDGHVTLYWGDGTEERKEVILRGPRPASGQELILIIEDLKAWAEDNGYTVIVPAYDLEAPDMQIELPEDEADAITLDDVDDLLDDLFLAEDDSAEDFDDEGDDDENDRY